MYFITESGLIPEVHFSFEILNSERAVYEVVRVKDGVALFLSEHFERLSDSMKHSNADPVWSYTEFKGNIDELIRVNKKTEGNIKIVVFPDGQRSTYVFAFIPHSYPSPEMYQAGVKVGLLNAERENPNAKIIQTKLRDRANQIIIENQFYEVLLVNQEGTITEGSRSNVFFLKGDVFYTAPESKVLAGITRSKVIECIREMGFTLVEESVTAEAVPNFDAVFLTGTSPKVLPVSHIGGHSFAVKYPQLEMLMSRYDQMVENYILQAK